MLNFTLFSALLTILKVNQNLKNCQGTSVGNCCDIIAFNEGERSLFFKARLPIS